MKKKLTAISILLIIVLTFSSCSFTVTPETIDNLVSNFSSSQNETVPLKEDYNGRKNYYYSSLDESKKIEYTKIYNGYMGLSDFNVKLNSDELSDMFNCVLYDNPEIFWVGSSYSFSDSPLGIFVEPDYRFSTEKIGQIKSAVEAEISRVAAMAGSASSDYTRELFFHDYICKNTVYDLATYDDFGDSAYNVLVEGKAICEGYSRAMKMLLDACGIYNYLVVGNTENEQGEMEGHMWNVVSVDGELYHVDVTWDDCDSEIGELNHLYLNLTDEDIRKDHFDIEPYDNGCTSLKFNYLVANRLYFDSFIGFQGIAAMCATALTDDLIAEMRFSNKDDYEKVKTKALNNETDRTFYDFTSDIIRISGRKIQGNSYVYNDDYNYLYVVFEKG